MSDSDDDIMAGGGARSSRRLRRRTGPSSSTAAGPAPSSSARGSARRAAAVANRRRLRDDSSDQSSGADNGNSDSGSEIEQSARKKKAKKFVEDDEAGPSGTQQPVVHDSSEWESDWNSDEEQALLNSGGQQAAAALVSKLGYASDSSTSSNDSEKCPICLLSLNDQEIGVPEVCEHIFCAPCIEEWSKNVTTCPIDRKNFDVINIYKSVDRKQLVRKNEVQVKAPDEVPLVEDHELTNCEVCRRPDREDSMLLCDSCNLGYHMDCLTPPLTEIPSGSWYCDCCFASGSDAEDDEEVEDLLNDLDEIGGVRQTRLRMRMNSPPRIVRTRQSERIRATILTRTATAVRLNVVEDLDQPGPSTRARSGAVGGTSARAAPARTVRKRRKRRTRRKILRMIISEYDVDNDDEKFAIKRKKIYNTLKKLSKKRSKRKRASRKSREATSGLNEEGADVQRQRFSTGIPTLKIFGGANDLDYFSDENAGDDDLEADVSLGGRGETAAISSIRATLRNPLGRRRVLKSGFEASSTSGSVDLLGSIMENQERWHSKKGLGDVKIDNGKIIFKNDSPQKKDSNPPGATQAGIGHNFQGGVTVSSGSNTGAADSTSSNRNGQSSETGGSSGVAAAASSTSSGAGAGGNNDNNDSVPDPSDMSIFVDLPPLKNPSEEDEDEKKKKKESFDMFGSEPIPLPSASTSGQPGPTSINPAPESTTADDSDLAPGSSKGFGKFKYTMTSEANNCPNFSVYSSETLQYAKTGGEEPYDPLDSEQKTDDEFEERDEDLVQLDDEEPAAQKPTDTPAEPDQEHIPNGTDKLPVGDLDHDAFDSDSDDELKKIEESSAPIGPEPEPTDELEALTPPLTTTVAAALASSGTAVTTTAGLHAETVVVGEASTTTAPSAGAAPANSAQGEEDRSYTPCLDEKYQEARREHDKSGSTPTLPPPSQKEGIDGMDTEMISDEDENTFKEDEARPTSASKPSSSGARKKDLAFKKVNKKGKERNYRDKETKKRDRNDNDKENHDRRSRERNRQRRPKRKELERYDVRTVIEKRPRVMKDPFGRDVTPRPRSKTRSRSRTRSRTPERRRELSISLSPEPPRRFNRRRSPSPRFRAGRNRSPLPFRRNEERRSLSRGPRMRSISRQRSRSPVVARPRLIPRSISRTPSPPPRARLPRSISRTPKSRSRTPDIRGAKTKKTKKKKRLASVSRSRSPSVDRGKKKTKKGRKKKNKHRSRSPGGKKKKTRRRSASPMMSRSRSRSTSIPPAQTTGVLTERFAKVRQQNSWTPPPPVRPKTNGTNLTVILTNEEALAKQAKERERKRKEARRRDRARDKNLPSKEVFTSGDNILVSVSFNDKNLNKENEAAAEGEAAAITHKRLKDMAKKRAEAEKAKRRRLERLKKTRGEAPKPVVIIDLDRSPFRVMTPSPRAVIVLSDSDNEKDKDRRDADPNRAGAAGNQQVNAESSTNGPSSTMRKSPAERHEEDMFGPKTPPGFPSQPQPSQSKPQAPKFSMQVKSKTSNIRPMNLLYEPGELDEGKTPERMDNAESSYSMVGPNTPPEPAPQSPSPDVYDPFEPTKSPSPSPPRRDNVSIERLSDLDDAVLPSSSGKPDGPDSGTGDPKADSQNQDEAISGEVDAPRGNKITILSNIVISQPTNSVSGVVSGSGVVSASQNNGGDDSDVIFDDFVSSSAPVPSSNVGYSTSGANQSTNPIKSYSTAANSSSLISKLPLPPGATAGQKFNDFINPTDSPYSPGASDFDDLFEAGGELDSPPAAPVKQSYKPTKILSKGAKKGGGGTFDTLFGSSPANNFKRGKKHKRRAKAKGDDDEDLSKLSTKDRFLKKLNRLERVVEEVKLVIKPFYNKKQINKDEYKDIMRRAVPKICHSRTGEINPIKIQKLIKAYVRKVRGRRRLAKKGGLAGGPGPLMAPGAANPILI
ncbi:PHD and RING finger domain-containing protein 1 [Aedes albopictus]|uniref:PHD and RING finger domain-containing protein 1 n=1 Tax=Aedes albopictus TaxID=7160 RepID=A0ABM1Z3E6_AEDAL